MENDNPTQEDASKDVAPATDPVVNEEGRSGETPAPVENRSGGTPAPVAPGITTADLRNMFAGLASEPVKRNASESRAAQILAAAARPENRAGGLIQLDEFVDAGGDPRLIHATMETILGVKINSYETLGFDVFEAYKGEGVYHRPAFKDTGLVATPQGVDAPRDAAAGAEELITVVTTRYARAYALTNQTAANVSNAVPAILRKIANARAKQVRLALTGAVKNGSFQTHTTTTSGTLATSDLATMEAMLEEEYHDGAIWAMDRSVQGYGLENLVDGSTRPLIGTWNDGITRLLGKPVLFLNMGGVTAGNVPIALINPGAVSLGLQDEGVLVEPARLAAAVDYAIATVVGAEVTEGAAGVKAVIAA